VSVPEARDPLGFWELIRSGTVTFRPIPPSRWDHSRFYDPTTRIPDKAYIDKGAYLEDGELREFASMHYGIAPRRVQVTDPQHRLLLDSVRAALQDAGYERRAWERTRAGVFVWAYQRQRAQGDPASPGPGDAALRRRVRARNARRRGGKFSRTR